MLFLSFIIIIVIYTEIENEKQRIHSYFDEMFQVRKEKFN